MDTDQPSGSPGLASQSLIGKMPAGVFESLPPALRKSSLQRLAFVCSMMIAALLLSEGVHWMQVWVNGDTPLWPNFWMRAYLIVLTLVVRFRLLDERHSPVNRLLLARGWIWLCGLGVVFLEFRSAPGGAPLAAAGISRGCIPVMLAPVLIPDSFKRSLQFSLLLLVTFPAGYVLSLLTGGDAQSASQMWVRIANDSIVMAAAWTTAATVHQLRQAVVEQFGSYRLIRRLGQGAFGEVWEARHRSLQRPAALKLISPSSDQATNMQRFMREAETLSGLQCPHTVQLYDYGQSEDGRLYLAMELLDGLDLDCLIKQHGPQPPERVASLLSQACLSLQEAHAQGLIHRDIKPANLFVCRLGLQADFVKVLDFGLVKTPSKAGLTQTDQVLGTPACMPPEFIMGQPVDGRSDLYGLGCVGYWLLTGHHVFEHDQFMQILFDHLHTDPVAPSQRLGTPLNHPLESLIMACLAKDPGQRPQSAELLFEELIKQPHWDNQQATSWWTHQGPKT